MLNDSFLFKKKTVKAKVTKTIQVAAQPLTRSKTTLVQKPKKSKSKQRTEQAENEQPKNIIVRSQTLRKEPSNFQDINQRSKSKEVKSRDVSKEANTRSVSREPNNRSVTKQIRSSSSSAESKIVSNVTSNRKKSVEDVLLQKQKDELLEEDISAYLDVSDPPSLDITRDQIVQDLKNQLQMEPNLYFQNQQTQDFQNFSDVKNLDPQLIQSVVKIDQRPVKLSEQNYITQGQIRYLESLKLKETCFQTFIVIEDCIQTISKHFNPQVNLNQFEAYVLLTDLTQRKQYLENFNKQFKKLCNHLVDLSSFMQKKESNYLGQIDQLQRQNNQLMQENMLLEKKISLETQSLNTQSDSNFLEIFKEFSNQILRKFDSVKQKVWCTDELAFNSSTGNRSEIGQKLLSQNLKVNQILSQTLEEVDSVKGLITTSLHKSHNELSLMRREAAQLSDKYVELKRKYNSVVEKILPQCKAMFQADLDYGSRVSTKKEMEEWASNRIGQTHLQLFEKIEALIQKKF